MHKYLGGDNITARVTHYDTNGKGGYRTLGTIKERDEILEEQLSLGMVVYVQSEKAEYRLDNLEPIKWTIQKSESATIDDSTTTSSTVWSSLKTNNEITAAKSEIVSNAPLNLNTLAKLATALNNNPNFYQYVDQALGTKLSSSNVYTRSEADAIFATKSQLHLHNNLATLQKIQELPNDASLALKGDGSWGSASSAIWGQITGTLANQLDLQDKLNLKSDLDHTHSIYLKKTVFDDHLLEFDHRDIHSHQNLPDLNNITSAGHGYKLLADNGTYRSISGGFANAQDILIQLRSGTAAEWTLENPILELDEPGLESDTRKTKYGDGVTAWADLPYAGGGGTGGGHTIQDDGTPLTQRAKLNLIGFTVEDDLTNDATKVSPKDPIPTLIAFTPEEGLVPNKLIIRLYFNTDMDADTINSTNIIFRKKV